ncbi:hypothetical protein [Streptomyces sp. NPDC050564]|uniref:hypothetical protein n=1 Tax=Streptomyces sp. NPDC050564 TaxID=3365631 RepID=UPI0037B2CF6E
MLELATEDGTPPPEPLPPGYGEILALFEQSGDGLRARDVCRTLGTGTEPRHTEGMRAKLKRLVLCPEHERELVVGQLLELVLCGR